MTDKEKKDETFEIISLKEKYLRDQLAVAEDSLVKSEFNVRINRYYVVAFESTYTAAQVYNHIVTSLILEVFSVHPNKETLVVLLPASVPRSIV